MIHIVDAIISLVPGAEVSTDQENNIIWHKPEVSPVTNEEIQAEYARLIEQEIISIQSKKDARQSALTKLFALGLTEEEALSLISK